VIIHGVESEVDDIEGLEKSKVVYSKCCTIPNLVGEWLGQDSKERSAHNST
jgi:hypothetical protein